MPFFLPMLSSSVYLCLPLYTCRFLPFCLSASLFSSHVPAFVNCHMSSSRWLFLSLPILPVLFLCFFRFTSLSLYSVILSVLLSVFCPASSIFLSCLLLLTTFLRFVALLLCLFTQFLTTLYCISRPFFSVPSVQTSVFALFCEWQLSLLLVLFLFGCIFLYSLYLSCSFLRVSVRVSAATCASLHSHLG
jgi:hypothetical protein